MELKDYLRATKVDTIEGVGSVTKDKKVTVNGKKHTQQVKS